MTPAGVSRLSRLAAVVALVLGAVALWRLDIAEEGVTRETLVVEGTPATVFRSASGSDGPAVVIAHGFAGSQQLMQSFALFLARRGYVAVTFDFAGHGRNPRPLGGSITQETGATAVLVAETGRIVEAAKRLGDGRVGLLGHSMASDIVIRTAQARPEVAATVAVSMFSPVVTTTSPRNLLVIVGDWEGMLKTEALRVAGLASAPEPPRPDVTTGDAAAGTARRVTFSPHVEHVGVLFSAHSVREAGAWFDTAFGIDRPPGQPRTRGPWILALMAAAVLLAWPASRLLPVVAAPPTGAGLAWRQGWLLLVPTVAAPLVLRVVPTHVLPVLVADYLAFHFAAYGALTAACLVLVRRPAAPRGRLRPVALALAAGAGVAFVVVALFIPIDLHVTAFMPTPGRLVLMLAMLAGTLAYFLANEWLTRGPGAGRGMHAASQAAFLVSLGIAVALDFERLFFLIIIVPVILLFMLVFGLMSGWVYRRTGHPAAAAVVDAVAFAWALGVTFPLLAG
ncbi:alpha/beta hydrolase [Alsobacter sp. R-9]